MHACIAQKAAGGIGKGEAEAAARTVAGNSSGSSNQEWGLVLLPFVAHLSLMHSRSHGFGAAACTWGHCSCPWRERSSRCMLWGFGADLLCNSAPGA